MNFDNIKTGDVLHCTGSRLISKLIRLATGSKFSHTAIFIWHNGVPCVADAQKDGFNIRTYENWTKDYNYTFRITRPLNDRINIEPRIMDLIGTTPYDFESLLIRQPKKIVREFLNRFRIKDKEPWIYRGEKENNRMYCSEAVAYCLGLPESYQMSPEELWEYCYRNHMEIE